ncbi:hypothetical protein LEL_10861 [Akanthomyces lecanii RCEF 1005]|uniref:Xylanolytic transcriptional activator regulatory domain-containing protein n=1 Tax=Akanthomyces lecanii RCEF 1005 TaxID=1081108 RepID=A0A167RSF8_CORDF|nr:hypothetical protein LEL_10861 [Akanthomyces lecanii RCEF 1005]
MNVDIDNIIRDFPVFDDATALLDHYTQSVDATYRILHRPTAWNMLDALYHDLNAGRTPSATQLAFFLCIFAGSVYVSKHDFQFESPSLHGHSQQALAEIWAQQAVQLLTDPPAPPSVPALQTIVSLAHLCTQMEGLRKNFNVLSAYGIQMARFMKLHRLDSRPSREERRKNGADMVDVEVKRRIWWHMAASDWLMSYNSGPNEGTYLLHPQQMETDHPSNVEDTNIPQGTTFLTEESYALPLTKPTSMTYFIHRIQSATLAREVVDNLPVSFFSSPALESCAELYENVKVMNQKYKRFIESLPPFFQLTIEDERAHAALIREMPHLEWQRYLINFVLHTQLARLHRPFLIRGSRQPEYGESRLQCIQSAEIVVHIRNRVMYNHSVGSFTYVMQHFLNAAIILAMDACFNPDKVHAPRRKQEVLRACRALEHDLNAKLVPVNGTSDEDMSSGQSMVQSFQNAVRNLRSTLKNHVREDDTDNTNSSAQDIGPLVAPPPLQQRRMATRSRPSMSTSNVGNLPPSEPFTGTGGHGNAADEMPVIEEEAADVNTPPDIVLDKLWDDFFSVGSTFNDTDWDIFFSDVGANMG